MNVIVMPGRRSLDTSEQTSDGFTTLLSNGSLLRSLPELSFSAGLQIEQRDIIVRRCENCGVWSNERICRCLKLLPPSSLDPRDDEFEVPEFDIGGEGG